MTKILPIDASFVFLTNVAKLASDNPGTPIKPPFIGFNTFAELSRADMTPLEEGWTLLDENQGFPVSVIEFKNGVSIIVDFERLQIRDAFTSEATRIDPSKIEKLLPKFFDRFSDKRNFAAFGYNITMLIECENSKEYVAQKWLNHSSSLIGKTPDNGTVTLTFDMEDDNRLNLTIAEAKVTYSHDNKEAKGVSLHFNYHLELGKKDKPERRNKFRASIPAMTAEAHELTQRIRDSIA